MNYEVTVSLQFDVTVEVEAGSEYEAIGLGEEKAAQAVPGCASYCANVVSIEEIAE